MTTVRISGISHTLIYLALGIACLVISTRNTVDCGEPGFPVLRNYLFGTGIAYTFIGSFYLVGIVLLFTIVGIVPLFIIAIASPLFTFAWMIVGAVSLWRDGSNCIQYNFEVWQMGMATVILSIILTVSTGVSSAYHRNAQQ